MLLKEAADVVSNHDNQQRIVANSFHVRIGLATLFIKPKTLRNLTIKYQYA